MSFFQLRLKKENLKKKLIIGKKIKKICKKFKVKLLINDDVFLTKKLNADGCHLGQKDMDILKARKLIRNKIIGVTCHNSIKFAKDAFGVWSYFSIPNIIATLFGLFLTFIFDGFKVSILFTIVVSFWSIIILTIFGSDLLPHWSVAIIDICSSTGLNLLILNLPLLTWIFLPSTCINTLFDLSETFPSIS